MPDGNDQERRAALYGRVFISGDIKAVTGLHIGGAAGALAVGGVDSPVIRDPLTSRPYVPGSSLRGKMRSLTEKAYGCVQNTSIGRDVYVHVCDDPDRYRICPVCPIFGVPSNKPASNPTRLVVRDVFMSDISADKLRTAQTDLPFSEVKWEATIDRVTSAAVPRQIERVPAGTVFDDFEMIYSVYHLDDIDRLVTVIEAMQLLEDDYLGGLGSRGSGQILFENLSITARSTKDYAAKTAWGGPGSVEDVLARKQDLLSWVRDSIITS